MSSMWCNCFHWCGVFYHIVHFPPAGDELLDYFQFGTPRNYVSRNIFELLEPMYTFGVELMDHKVCSLSKCHQSVFPKLFIRCTLFYTHSSA